MWCDFLWVVWYTEPGSKLGGRIFQYFIAQIIRDFELRLRLVTQPRGINMI